MKRLAHSLTVSILALVVPALLLAAATPDGSWLRRVPASDRARENPFSDNKGTTASRDAVAAGQVLFRRNCVSCHGEAASGRGSHPSLRIPRVQQATDGELYWLLTNGSLGRGMPSWSRLPDPQRWQLVRYLHSLQP